MYFQNIISYFTYLCMMIVKYNPAEACLVGSTGVYNYDIINKLIDRCLI